jgi:hypothetical protein
MTPAPAHSMDIAALEALFAPPLARPTIRWDLLKEAGATVAPRVVRDISEALDWSTV